MASDDREAFARRLGPQAFRDMVANHRRPTDAEVDRMNGSIDTTFGSPTRFNLEARLRLAESALADAKRTIVYKDAIIERILTPRTFWQRLKYLFNP